MPAAEQLADDLARRFLDRHPQDAVAVLDTLPAAQAAQILGTLEIPAALALLNRFAAHFAARCLEQVPVAQAAVLLEALPLRTAVEIFGRLAHGPRSRCIEHIPARRAQVLLAGIQGLQDSVAGLMDTQIPQLPEDALVGQAIELLERTADELVGHFYVTDNAARLSGMLSVRQLYAAHPDQRLGSLPLRAIPRLPANARVAPILAHPGWSSYTRLPVVDMQGRLLGELRRERLDERGRGAADESEAVKNQGALGMTLALLEGYTAANLLILDLLVRGARRHD